MSFLRKKYGSTRELLGYLYRRQKDRDVDKTPFIALLDMGIPLAVKMRYLPYGFGPGRVILRDDISGLSDEHIKETLSSYILLALSFFLADKNHIRAVAV